MLDNYLFVNIMITLGVDLMKKLYIILDLLLLIIFNNNVLASHNVVNESNVQISVNKNIFELMEVPLNINCYTYISVIDIHNIFGYNYKFNSDKKELNLSYESVDNISNGLINNDCEALEYDLYIEDVHRGKAYSYNNLLYVPLRIIAESNSCDIYWNDETNTIDLNYNIYNIEGRKALCALNYTNSMGYTYIFVSYENIIDNSKSMLMVEYDGVINGEFTSIKDLMEKVDIKNINDRKIININKDEYQVFISKVNNLLNEKNDNSISASYQCDFTCYIVFNKGNSNAMFKSYPILETTQQYDELKKYVQDISGYSMEYITPYNI